MLYNTKEAGTKLYAFRTACISYQKGKEIPKSYLESFFKEKGERRKNILLWNLSVVFAFFVFTFEEMNVLLHGNALLLICLSLYMLLWSNNDKPNNVNYITLFSFYFKPEEEKEGILIFIRRFFWKIVNEWML